MSPEGLDPQEIVYGDPYTPRPRKRKSAEQNQEQQPVMPGGINQLIRTMQVYADDEVDKRNFERWIRGTFAAERQAAVEEGRQQELQDLILDSQNRRREWQYPLQVMLERQNARPSRANQT